MIKNIDLEENELDKVSLTDLLKYWKEEYVELLELVLINQEFDFENAQPAFNQAV